jgi:hypothetical protein
MVSLRFRLSNLSTVLAVSLTLISIALAAAKTITRPSTTA